MMAGKWVLPRALAALGHFVLPGSVTQPIRLCHTHSWGGPVQELASMVLVGPFHLRLFCGSLVQVMLRAAGPAGTGNILRPATGAETGAEGFVNRKYAATNQILGVQKEELLLRELWRWGFPCAGVAG